MPIPNAQSNRYPYPFPLNIYSSLFSQRPRVVSFCIPFHLPFAPHSKQRFPATQQHHQRDTGIRGHLTPKKRGAGGDFGLRANPLSRGKLMGVVGAIGGRVINFSCLLHQVPPVLYRWENRVGEHCPHSKVLFRTDRLID